MKLSNIDTSLMPRSFILTDILLFVIIHERRIDLCGEVLEWPNRAAC